MLPHDWDRVGSSVCPVWKNRREYICPWRAPPIEAASASFCSAMSRLTILMYHRVDEIPRETRHPKNFVTPGRFAEQIEALLHWGYEPVTFAHWLDYRHKKGRMPRKPFIVTFDDGYADFA